MLRAFREVLPTVCIKAIALQVLLAALWEVQLAAQWRWRRSPGDQSPVPDVLCCPAEVISTQVRTDGVRYSRRTYYR
jgi:hypothetical protein